MEKISGAIQGINEPKPALGVAVRLRHVILFGDYGAIRPQIAKCFYKDVVRCDIRSSDGALVNFRVNNMLLIAINFHDRIASFAGDGQEPVEQGRLGDF